jgi:uncharacterized repeat protein (TIGR01451 family)
MRRSWKDRRAVWIALVFGAAALSGCAHLQAPRIDPTGQRLFVQGPVVAAPRWLDEPRPQLPWDDVAVTLTPAETVAPIRSEVILTAGVVGPDNFLRTNRRLEWSLDPGGVGHFVAVGRGTWTDLLLLDFNRPRKIDATFAVGSTSRQYLRLHRGTPDAEDDVCVLRGQGWISVTSPVEGTSHVSVVAPEVYPWDARQRSAAIHWVDAGWTLPSPAINPAGTSHRMTTTVYRQSDGSPCAGWVVRYRVAGGPPAGFGPEGAAAVETTTDSAGQATVELFQKEPVSGTNPIAIEIVRPAGAAPGGRALTVGDGATLATWSAPGLTLRKTGPAVAGLGATLVYRIEVANPGDVASQGVAVAQDVPNGLTYVESQPPAEVAAGRLSWSIGQLGPGEVRRIEVAYRAEQVGSVTCCAEATAAGGLRATDCATTTISSAQIELRLTGPAEAAVGSRVTFQIVVTNRGAATAAGLLLKDDFDAGLEHEAARSPIEADLGDLGPGQSRPIHVEFIVRRPGRLCHLVEVLGPGGERLAAEEGCVTGVPPATPPAAPPSPPPVAPPATPPAAPSEVVRPSITVRKTGPAERTVGQTAEFEILVTNTGDQPAASLRVVDRFDAGLKPTDATEDHRYDGRDLVWTIDALRPGATTKLEVHCECTQASVRACNRVSVVAAGEVVAEDAACLVIHPAPDDAIPPPEAARLTLTVADVADPVFVRQEVPYVIHVTNRGAAADSQVSVTVTLPAGMSIVWLGTTGPPGIQARGVPPQVRFDPLPALGPGQTATFNVRAMAAQPGVYRVRVEVSSRGQPQPVTAEETTEVLARPGG